MNKLFSRKFIRKLYKKDTWFVVFALFIFSLLRIPSIVEPYWYGDEGIYEVIGMSLRAGGLLYRDIWDNKPPILYLIYQLFSGDQFSVRTLSLLFGAASVVVFFLVAKKLFHTRRSQYVSTGVFMVLFGLPILEGNIANAENFMLLPILCAFYFVISLFDVLSFKKTFIAGLLLSFAFLTKIVAVFDFGAFVVSIAILRLYDEFAPRRGNIFKKIPFKKIILGSEQELILGAGFVLPIIATILFFVAKGAFTDFYKAVFSQNVGYVSYGNYFLFPQGLLVLKLILLSAGIGFVWQLRHALGKSGVVILIWIFFSLFNASFSERPYTHYLLVLLASFSLFLGYIFEDKKLSIIKITFLVALIAFVYFNFNLYKKIVPYYQNYMSFVFGNKNAKEYQRFFDGNTPRDYELANIVRSKTSKSDGIFIWGDQAQIYALSGKLPPGRYTVSYHVTFYKNAIGETLGDINRVQPKYIIQTKTDGTIENFLASYVLKYKIDGAQIYERQY